MRIFISTARNGVTVRFEHGNDVFSFDEEDQSGLVEMLYAISEAVGPTANRYAKERVQVSLVHGDKYECAEAKCGVCGSGSDR